jgi:hypothetical protein
MSPSCAPIEAGVVVDHVDAGNRHAHVVGDGPELLGRDDPAHGLLDACEHVRRFLHARADLRAHMHEDRAAVDRGKKLRPRNGSSANEATTKARKPATKALR